MTKRENILTIVILCIIGVSLICTYFGMRSDAYSRQPASDQGFFTIDDGKSWFAAPATEIPPFMFEGKVAVGARIFTCDGGKTEFCGYLEEYDPEVIRLFNLAAEHPGDKAAFLNAKMAAMAHGPEVKRPGDREWVKRTDGASYAQIVNVQRDGAYATLIR